MVQFGGEVGMGEKTQGVQPVVDCDDNDAARRDMGAIITRLRPGAGDESATVNPDHGGELAPHRRARPASRH